MYPLSLNQFSFLNGTTCSILYFITQWVCTKQELRGSSHSKDETTLPKSRARFLDCFGLYFYFMFDFKSWNFLITKWSWGEVAILGCLKWKDKYKFKQRHHWRNVIRTLAKWPCSSSWYSLIADSSLVNLWVRFQCKVQINLMFHVNHNYTLLSKQVTKHFDLSIIVDSAHYWIWNPFHIFSLNTVTILLNSASS